MEVSKAGDYMLKNTDILNKKGVSDTVRAVDITNLSLCAIFIFINSFVVIVYVNMPEARKKRTCNVTLLNHVCVSAMIVIYKLLHVVFWYDAWISNDKWRLHQILYVIERYVIIINVGSFLLFSADRFISVHWQQFRLAYLTRKHIVLATVLLWLVTLIPACVHLLCISRCSRNVDIIVYFAETIVSVVGIGMSYLMLLMSYNSISKALRLSRDQETIQENRRQLEYFKVLFAIITYFCLAYIPIPVYKTLFPVDQGQLHFKLLKDYPRYFTVVTVGDDCKNSNYSFGLWDIVCTFFFTSTPVFNAILTLCRKDDYTEGLYKILKGSGNSGAPTVEMEQNDTHTHHA